MNDLPVRQILIDEFVKCWSKIDKAATGFIKVTDLERLLIDVAEQDDGRKFFDQY